MGQYLQGFSDDVEGEPGVQRVYAQYTSGSTGAISTINRDIGFSAITRTGTGVVDFVLNNPAFKLLGWIANIIQASPAAAGACTASVVDAVSSTPTPKVTLTFRTADGNYAAVDTASGDVVRLTLLLKTVQLGA